MASPGSVALDVHIDYRLTADGLSVTTTATNIGDRRCPYGCGQCSYLSRVPGSSTTAPCTVLQTRESLQTRTANCPSKPNQQAAPPTTSAGKTLSDLEVDYAFTSLTRDADDRAWVRLTGSDGRVAELWVDRDYPIIEIFTADTLAPDRRRQGLGSEATSCPPNAFQSGADVLRLEPGESTRSPCRPVTRTAPPRPAAGIVGSWVQANTAPRLRPVVLVRVAPALPGHPLQSASDGNQ